MRKILVLCLIVGLVMAMTGSSCIQKMEGMLCNPTASQQQAATAGIAIANSILAVLTAIPQTTAVAAIVTSLGGAEVIFQTIQSGGCVLVTQLQDALNAIDQGQAAQAVMVKQAPLITPDPLQPLRDWVK